MSSTYNFKHRECLQLHCFCFFGVPSFISELGLGLDFGESGFLQKESVWSYQDLERSTTLRYEDIHMYHSGKVFMCLCTTKIQTSCKHIYTKVIEFCDQNLSNIISPTTHHSSII